ncbi:MAG: hypothetical protein JXR83_08180 [Deltaproteobacteria bacterium]|nr:hypothetical protein [Deltaproteobacteria bacterium]
MRWSVLLIAGLLAAPGWAGKLDDASDAIHGSSDDDDDDDAGDSTSSDEDGDDGDGVAGLADCGMDLFLPELVELVSSDSAGYGDSLSFFVRPPYFRDGRLLLLFPQPADEAISSRLAAEAMRRGGVPFAQWLSTSYAYDLAGVHRLALSAGFDTASRLGAQAEIAHYVEPQPGHTDKLLVGQAAGTFRLVQAPDLVSRVALGVVLQRDAGGVAAGLLLSEDIEVYPWSPLVISGRAELGWLGKALTVKARAVAGISVHGWELFAGYDLWGLGGDQSSAVLHGPLVGMRAWL